MVEKSGRKFLEELWKLEGRLHTCLDYGERSDHDRLQEANDLLYETLNYVAKVVLRGEAQATVTSMLRMYHRFKERSRL